MRPKRTDRTLAALGQAIRAYRVAAGLTQEQLAEAVGLHPGFLGTVERGEKTISITNLVAICQALGVLPSALVTVLDLAIQKPAVARKRQSPKTS